MPQLDLVVVETYNVSVVERRTPTCDMSKQVSLAAKEASGIGSMELMDNWVMILGRSKHVDFLPG